MALRPEKPLLLLLRTPQALTAAEEADLRAALTGVLQRRVFSERSSQQEQDGELVAEARRRVHLSSLDDDSAFSALHDFMRSESELGGVLWLDPSSRGEGLDCRYAFRRGSAAFQSGRLKTGRRELPAALLVAGLRPERAPLLPEAAPARPGLDLLRGFTRSLTEAPPPPEPASAPRAPRLREPRSGPSEALLQERRERLAEDARQHAERFEEWSEEFSSSFEDWADDFDQRLEDWRERFEDQIDELGQSLESACDSSGNR